MRESTQDRDKWLDRSTQTNSKDIDSYQLARAIAAAAEDRKAADIVLLGVEEISYLTEYFVIVTGFSKTQVKAIADSIETKIAENFGKHPLRSHGKSEGSWIVQDYSDVIVHIFLPEEREYYNLEAFWGHAQRIDFSMSN